MTDNRLALIARARAEIVQEGAPLRYVIIARALDIVEQGSLPGDVVAEALALELAALRDHVSEAESRSGERFVRLIAKQAGLPVRAPKPSELN